MTSSRRELLVRRSLRALPEPITLSLPTLEAAMRPAQGGS